MTRRAELINFGRLALLRWRVIPGRALPWCATALLRWLDQRADSLHPWGSLR